MYSIILFAETPIDMDLDEYSDPTAFFRNFFIDESLQYICDESNKYGVQTNPNKPLLLTKNELTIHRDIINDLYHQIPSAKSCWKLETCNYKTTDVMGRNSFLKSNDLFIAMTI